MNENYELLQEKKIEEQNTMAYYFRHKKTGARVAVLSNEDENKVFSIGFRTPPKDDTGVPHIIEHTVLCGSKAFPVKDPFVELVKGSLNTFLNAMTYPDKTIYPVASCNRKDFCNLMHVYLDAVFYPNIYREKKIFLQEGWHREMTDPQGELTLNGVVYNEMKGAYSDPEEPLSRLIMRTLYPNTPYAKESGGEPEHIPDLTYEDYLAFHETYYHPSNSFIYLYGDMDVEERLQWMHEEYLSHFSLKEVDSEIPLQPVFPAFQRAKGDNAIGAEESEGKKSIYTYNQMLPEHLSPEEYLAADILNYALTVVPGAPLKEALLKAGLGLDISGSVTTSLRQPLYSLVAKEAPEGKEEAFLSCVRSTLEKLVTEGIPKDSLRAGLNLMEFQYREADFGPYPRGLMYGIQMLESWLYHTQEPFLYLGLAQGYENLKEKIDQGYFETLLSRWLLQNTNGALVTLSPKKGLTEAGERALKEKLENIKQGLSLEERERVVEETKALKKYQQEPSSQEELEKIPLLAPEDIEKNIREIKNVEDTIGEVPLLYHPRFSNGILYFKACFDASDLTKKEIALLGFLTQLLGKVQTGTQSYTDFSNACNLHTGGMVAAATALKGKKKPLLLASLSVKMLEEELETGLSLFFRMATETRFTEETRLAAILQEQKSLLGASLSGAGHHTATIRCSSYETETSGAMDRLNGIDALRFYEEMDGTWEEQKENLKKDLEILYKKIFTKKRLLLSLTCAESALNKVKQAILPHLGELPEGAAPKAAPESWCNEKAKEGFRDSGQVQYVARGGNFVKDGFSYHGSMGVLRMILGYDYLWNQVRVQGGAYGCMTQFTRDGGCYFVSYRDPNLKETNEVYEKIPAYVSSFQCSKRDLTKFVIGTISGMDTPLGPMAMGERDLSVYLGGYSPEELQKERDQVLWVTQEDIRKLAPLLQGVLDQGNFCVIGSETKIREQEALFDHIEDLKN